MLSVLYKEQVPEIRGSLGHWKWGQKARGGIERTQLGKAGKLELDFGGGKCAPR